MRHIVQLKLNHLFSGTKVCWYITYQRLAVLLRIVFFIGRASIYILRTAFGVDWSERIKIIYAGDDDTDEDAMMVSILSFKISGSH